MDRKSGVANESDDLCKFSIFQSPPMQMSLKNFSILDLLSKVWRYHLVMVMYYSEKRKKKVKKKLVFCKF